MKLVIYGASYPEIVKLVDAINCEKKSWDIVGFLDDVIIIELAVRELLHVREAYEDFCEYRDDYDKKNRGKNDSAVRRDRIDKKRQKLHQRMKRRMLKDRRAKKSTALW